MTETPETSAEQILVCIDAGLISARLISSAKRTAAGLHAKWFAVCIENPKALMLSEAERNRMEDNLRLAEQLGAEIATLSGRSIAEEIISFARRAPRIENYRRKAKEIAIEEHFLR